MNLLNESQGLQGSVLREHLAHGSEDTVGQLEVFFFFDLLYYVIMVFIPLIGMYRVSAKLFN